jgi:hypothetical protein
VVNARARDRLTVFRICLLMLTACACRSAPPSRPAPACAPRDESKVVEAIVKMYDALRADDVAAFRARTSADFYAFEQGKRFDGDALVKLIVEAHTKGRRFVWTVKQPTVRIDCNLASIAYVNEGSIGDASQIQERSWLESAALSYDAGSWHVRFFHSTRVPTE